MDLDQAIDELYQQAPGDFTAARNTLAKTLKGDAAARVRALAKPTIPAWAVNQLYWRDRRLFDRLVNEGARLRNAQIAALQGRAADVRAASEAHRAAVGAAVQRATELARDANVDPDPDIVARTLEALSLSPSDATPGRLTRPLRPAGFEALTGITLPAAISRPEPSPRPGAALPSEAVPRAPAREPKASAARQREEARAARRAEALARTEAHRQALAAKAAEKQRDAKRRAAEREVERARREKERARHALAEAERKVAAAELKLRGL